MCSIVLRLQPGAAAVGVRWESAPLDSWLGKAGRRKQIGHMTLWAHCHLLEALRTTGRQPMGSFMGSPGSWEKSNSPFCPHTLQSPGD